MTPGFFIYLQSNRIFLLFSFGLTAKCTQYVVPLFSKISSSKFTL